VNKITRFYKDLTEEIQNMGWKVRHVKMAKLAGECKLSNKLIRIHPAYKNTLMGCYILGHEAGHMVDFLDKKYKKFYHSKNGYCNNKKLIEKVEWSATKFSIKLLKQRNFNLSKIPEAKRSWFKKELKFWYKKYMEKKCLNPEIQKNEKRYI